MAKTYSFDEIFAPDKKEEEATPEVASPKFFSFDDVMKMQPATQPAAPVTTPAVQPIAQETAQPVAPVVPTSEAPVVPEEKGFLSNIAGSVPKSWLNLKQAVVSMTLPDLIGLKENAQAKYGPNYENASDKERADFLNTEKVISEKLATLTGYGAEAKALNAKYGLTPIKQKIEDLQKNPEYEQASTFDQFKKLGSLLLDNPASIPAYLATVTVENLPTSFATIAPAILGRYAGFSSNVSAALGGTSSAMTEFGGNYMDLREKGMSHDEAWEKAAIKSGVIGLLDAASFKTAGATAENIFGQAQKAAITNGLKVAGKEAGVQAGLGAGGEGLGTTIINEKIDPVAVLEEAAGEVAGAPAKAFSTYREGRKPGTTEKVEPPLGTTTEKTTTEPAAPSTKYDYLDTPKYEDVSNRIDEATKQSNVLQAKIDSFAEGTPERDKAVREYINFFDKTLNPLFEERDSLRPKQETTEQATTETTEPAKTSDQDIIWMDQQAMNDELAGLENETNKPTRVEPTLTETPVAETLAAEPATLLKNAQKTASDVLSNDTTFPEDFRNDPLVHEYAALSASVTHNEKNSNPETWTQEESDAWESGDWKTFSKLRGYTENQIAEFERMLELDRQINEKYSNPEATLDLNEPEVAQNIYDAIYGKKTNIEETPVKKTPVEEVVSEELPSKPVESLDKYLTNNGFTFLPEDSKRNFQDFATFEKDGVRVALSNHALGYSKNRVMMITPVGKFANSLTVQAIIVDKDKRNQGKAREAMQLLTDRADQTGTTLYVEPLPINDKTVTSEGLKKFYTSLGFEPKGEKVMVREPNSVKTPVEETPAKELPELDITGIKAPKGRNPYVVAAGKLFQAGKMSREDFNAYVDKYTPIAEIPVDKIAPPTPLEKILSFFKSPKETERVKRQIPNGTKVGLRMDLPAKNAGLPVVSIHEGKPNNNPKTGKPYASAGEVIKYASTAHIKNVDFSPRSQEKSLNMGLNPIKEPLQTAEGEWVNTSPEETFKQVKALTGTEGWTQVGFDPARHGYFYDRATGKPVVRASELYQVGSLILAKDVQYGEKENFLYNIETGKNPAYGGQQRSPSLKRAVSKLFERWQNGLMTSDELALALEKALDSTSKDRYQALPKRVRGADIIREKLLAAKRRGELSEEAVDLAEWFIKQNESLVADLGLSIKAPKEEDTGLAGFYNSFSRIFALFKGSENELTPVHEILHHLERMMPENIRKAIRKEWIKSLLKAAKKADKGTDQNLKDYYTHLIDHHINNDPFALNKAKKLLVEGKVDSEHYENFNPSEFWAINGSDIVQGQIGRRRVGKECPSPV